MLEAMWKRARSLHDDGNDVMLVPAIDDFWGANEPDVQQYLKIEEFTVLQQIQNWTEHSDKALNDLARRFLARNRFRMLDPPQIDGGLAPNYDEWEETLMGLVRQSAQYDPPDMYCLRDLVKGKYNQPYFPEKEADEQSVKNAIRLLVDGEPIEISKRLDRLKPLTEEPTHRIRYYVPNDVYDDALALRKAMSKEQ